MSAMTYYVVLPFKQGRASKKGRPGLIPGEAREARSEGDAIRAAKACEFRGGAALAFSRRGDPKTGDFDDAVILGVFGPVPDEALTGE